MVGEPLAPPPAVPVGPDPVVVHPALCHAAPRRPHPGGDAHDRPQAAGALQAAEGGHPAGGGHGQEMGAVLPSSSAAGLAAVGLLVELALGVPGEEENETANDEDDEEFFLKKIYTYSVLLYLKS